ncbi:hypothetical protein VPH35_134374 [Triticum aestivum]|uniref:Uncharacterized protein n=1 Tax=Aegilops tauschii TaxID=37682 RepID=M8D570_AEGTA
MGDERIVLAYNQGSTDASVVVKQGVESSAAPAAAPCGSKGKKYRLKKNELRTIIALRPEPFLEDDYVDDLAEFFPPEWIKKKKREQVEDAAYFGKIDEEFEAFRQQGGGQ